jgi:AraC-like DNA-binding protein
METLDDLLRTLRFQSNVNSRIQIGEPWGVSFPADPGACEFHYIESGGGRLLVPGEAPVELGPGNLALVMNRRGHAVTDRHGSPTRDVYDLVAELGQICVNGSEFRMGGDGPITSVVSGQFRFDDFETHPLLRSMPTTIVLRGEQGKAIEWLEYTLCFIVSESTAGRPGASAVLDRLCDMLFIQAFRGWARDSESEIGWPAAMRDPAVASALDLMHRECAAPWTLARLADRVAMSRSSFAERFRRVLGESPMGYLARWRMHQAAGLLREGRLPVAAIAERVGYESEAAFAKAFKRTIGVAPGAYRRGGGVAEPVLA